MLRPMLAPALILYTNNDTLRIPLVAVFPHPFHGRLVERVILMVSHMFNYKGIRYRFAWKNSGVAYYFQEAEELGMTSNKPNSRQGF